MRNNFLGIFFSFFLFISCNDDPEINSTIYDRWILMQIGVKATYLGQQLMKITDSYDISTSPQICIIDKETFTLYTGGGMQYINFTFVFEWYDSTRYYSVGYNGDDNTLNLDDGNDFSYWFETSDNEDLLVLSKEGLVVIDQSTTTNGEQLYYFAPYDGDVLPDHWPPLKQGN